MHFAVQQYVHRVYSGLNIGLFMNELILAIGSNVSRTLVSTAVESMADFFNVSKVSVLLPATSISFRM